MNQAGSGLAGFQGVRYQKGNGFMGRLVTGTVMPILKKVLPFLGKTVLNAGSNIIQDFENGGNLKESASKRFNETKTLLKSKSLQKLKELTGGGRKKTRTNKRKNIKKRKPKKKKQTKRRIKRVACDFL